MYAGNYEPPEHQDQSWMRWVFWVGVVLTIIGANLLFSSCSTIKYVDRWHTEYRDTTIVKKETRDSLIYVPIPLESNQVIVAVGDTSRLETSVAKSEAYVGNDGFLHHKLENKRTKLPAIVPVTGTYIYTGVSQKEAQTLTKIEYVEKSLSWWQNFRIKAFWWLLGGLVLALLWIFRKPIAALLKIV